MKVFIPLFIYIKMVSKDNIISVKDLVKRFGKFVAVDNISFEVNKGDIFAFLGPNGAGKTTTIRMLTTLLKPSSGSIFVNGYNRVAFPPAKITICTE